jgi:hypothetical protein
MGRQSSFGGSQIRVRPLSIQTASTVIAALCAARGRVYVTHKIQRRFKALQAKSQDLHHRAEEAAFLGGFLCFWDVDFEGNSGFGCNISFEPRVTNAAQCPNACYR